MIFVLTVETEDRVTQMCSSEIISDVNCEIEFQMQPWKLHTDTTLKIMLTLSNDNKTSKLPGTSSLSWL